jgi:hypothetical protein
MSVHYRHTQTGKVIIVMLALGALLMAVLMRNITNWIVVLGIGSLLVVGILFGTLTVEVARGKIRCWFGPGLIRKEFSLEEVTTVEAVRNRWYYGWGIRYTPHGWLFNVSGFDAVAITLSSGKQFRIGTDQPHELERAIRRGAELST